MFLVHEGQLEGRRIRVPVQLLRRPSEGLSESPRAFYVKFLEAISSPEIRHGQWRMLPVRPGWHDNPTWQNYLAFWWEEPSSGIRMVIVNYAPHPGQCYVEVPTENFAGETVEFRDLLAEAVYHRDKRGLEMKGMYFDLTGYGIHIFRVSG
jgi:hypothetical protein